MRASSGSRTSRSRSTRWPRRWPASPSTRSWARRRSGWSVLPSWPSRSRARWTRCPRMRAARRSSPRPTWCPAWWASSPSCRALGLVVQLDGAGDLRLGAGGLGVVAAHQALQLGELAHHAGHQVGLGELRGAARILRHRVHCARDLEGELGDALHPLLLRAQLLVEGDAAERRGHLVERLLEVLLPEEARIRQPRRNHLLVAGDDLLAAVLGREVRHQQEAVSELSRLGVLEREALLVLLHGGGEHLARHLQERLVEMPHQYQGPFGETGVLGQQRLVLDQGELVLLGERARLLGNEIRALGRVEHHLVALQRR